MKRILVISQDSNESLYPLDKERLVLGRSEECDIKLKNEGLSRQHAVVTFRFDSVYIENLSSSGQLLKDGSPVEYVQLQEGEEVVIGPFNLFWTWDGKRKSTNPSQDNIQASPDDIAPVAPPEEGGQTPELENVSSSEEAGAKHLQSSPEDSAIPVSFEVGGIVTPSPAAESLEQNFIQEQPTTHSQLTNNEQLPTQLLGMGGPHGILTVLKGEELGREIRLDYGAQWTIGRSPNTEIQINNPKLSRTHFRIVKIANGYRIQDLGSANGTHLNGVAISDAPLQVFDTIKAGPVELEFKIVDPKHLPAQALLENQNLNTFEQQEKTAFAAPMPYQQSTSQEQPKTEHFSFSFKTPNPKHNSEEPSINRITAKDKIIIWWGAQPKKKKSIYGVIAALLLTMLLVPTEEAQGPTPASQEIAPQPEVNLAQSQDIAPEFNLKSDDERRRIEELYAEAHAARNRRDWKKAFTAAAAVLDPKSGITKYKDAAEILDEAQTYLNEEQVGTLTKNVSALEEAKIRNEDKVTALIESGEKAIQEGRWEDAQEAFTKAMTLDPNNKRASRGFTASFSKNPYAITPEDIPDEQVQVDEHAEAKKTEQEEIDNLQKDYQNAKLAIFDGNYRQAIPTLNKLENKLQEKIEALQNQPEDRMPASETDKFSTQSRALLSLVKEAQDRITTEFRMEYQGQMSDAEVAISNKQYVQAREIYDNIVKRDPAYSEPSEAREKLYELIINEAKNMYHEGLVYESVGDLTSAVTSFKETLSLLKNVEQYTAEQYRTKAEAKLKVLAQ